MGGCLASWWWSFECKGKERTCNFRAAAAAKSPSDQKEIVREKERGKVESRMRALSRPWLLRRVRRRGGRYNARDRHHPPSPRDRSTSPISTLESSSQCRVRAYIHPFLPLLLQHVYEHLWRRGRIFVDLRERIALTRDRRLRRKKRRTRVSPPS